ncbi:MAG TPA: hypothetical protein VEJ38_11090 [Candidatus Acidoferrales bacterium]|nr:hypothetical protein [Candidatus Acidoferrales bacterium]
MQDRLRDVIDFAKHDPAAVAGWILVGASSVLFFHMHLRLIRAGYKTSFSFFGKPLSWNGWDALPQYLKVRTRHGWSLWPVYLIVPCLLTGIVLLIFGVFHL